jgi:hypothetical protein
VVEQPNSPESPAESYKNLDWPIQDENSILIMEDTSMSEQVEGAPDEAESDNKS